MKSPTKNNPAERRSGRVETLWGTPSDANFQFKLGENGFHLGIAKNVCLEFRSLYSDLWHAKWLLEMHNETEPMFLSFFVALGPFLLLAARDPSAHRSLITFTAWWNLAHAAVMAIETVQAWNRGVRRDFTDVVIVAAIGLILLALSTARRNQSTAVLH